MSPRFDVPTHALAALFWSAIGVSTLTAAYSALSARDLVYDGSFYLLAIAKDRNFHIFEPARLSVQVLQQIPAVFGARLGIDNLWTLGRLFSLGMSGWPVVLTALCWLALPRGEKNWIAGPFVNIIFAIPAASFIGISEGIIASCLVWLAVLLVMFRLAQPFGALMALVASTACAVAHEATVLCLLLIGWLAAARFTRLQGFPRFASALVAAFSATGAFYMALCIALPRSAVERGDFLVSILGGFVGSPSAPNVPAITGILAALFIAVARLARRLSTFVAATGVIAVLACGVVFAFAPSALASPSRFFAARGLPVALTTMLSVLFVLLHRRGTIPRQPVTRPEISILTALIFSQALMQAAATNLWHDFVNDLRTLVTTKHGVIPHTEAMAALNPSGNRFRRELLESWSVEPLSILLAAGGAVRAVVEPAATARWVPYRFAEPQTLPHLPQLDWSHFPATRGP